MQGNENALFLFITENIVALILMEHKPRGHPLIRRRYDRKITMIEIYIEIDCYLLEYIASDWNNDCTYIAY